MYFIHDNILINNRSNSKVDEDKIEISELNQEIQMRLSRSRNSE